MKALKIAIVLLVVVTLLFASSFSGVCSHVYNHNTITIKQGYAALRVRLYDVGEVRTPQGTTMSSQAYLESLVLNKKVTVRQTSNQEYTGAGSITGTVFVNGVNINQKMLNEGYAYRYGEEVDESDEPTFGLEPQPIGPSKLGTYKSGPDKLMGK